MKTMEMAEVMGKGKPVLRQNLTPELLYSSGILIMVVKDKLYHDFIKKKKFFLNLDKDLAMKCFRDNLFSMGNSVNKN